jgi:hypothetical protein
MKLNLVAACLGSAVCCATLHASIMPVVHIDAAALEVFTTYVAQFERNVMAPWAQSGQMWMDSSSCCGANSSFAAGKPVVEPRESKEIAGGSMHHYSGVIRIQGGTIENVRKIMRDYPNYPTYFKPDIAKGSGIRDPDSTATDEHYTSQLSLVQSTVWMSISYDCTYDTHYRLTSPHHWESVSNATSIREWRDPKDVSQGYYPEGEDHGFLWGAHTYWLVRERDGGIDVEADSITVSRSIPTGFGWWGSKRTRDAIDKMLRNMKTAVDALH